MKVIDKNIIVAVIILLIVSGFYMLLNGFFSRVKDTHPPCDQLPTVEEANVALVEHEIFVKEIEALGEYIEVKVGQPCADDKSRGLIKVNYKTKSERDAIQDLLSHSEGLGVPVYLEKY